VSPGAMVPLSCPSHLSGLAQTLPKGSTAPMFTRSIIHLQDVTSQKSILPPEMTVSFLKTQSALLPPPAGRWAELPCKGTQACSEGEKETPWCLSPKRQGAMARESGVHTCTKRGCTPDPTISDGCIYYNLFMDETVVEEKGSPEQ